MVGCELIGCHVLLGVVRTDSIVFFDPEFNNLTHLLQRIEQIGIQNVFTKRAVETLDVGILRGLAGLDVSQFHHMLPSPGF